MQGEEKAEQEIEKEEEREEEVEEVGAKQQRVRDIVTSALTTHLNKLKVCVITSSLRNVKWRLEPAGVCGAADD